MAGGVCPNDPLLFTCQLKDIIALRIVLPSGIQEVVSLSNTPTDVNLPAGFTVASLGVSDVNGNSILYKLTISIANASLLDGGEIICDDITQRKVAVARCPLVGKLSTYNNLHNVLYIDYYGIHHIIILRERCTVHGADALFNSYMKFHCVFIAKVLHKLTTIQLYRLHETSLLSHYACSIQRILQWSMKFISYSGDNH